MTKTHFAESSREQPDQSSRASHRSPYDAMTESRQFAQSFSAGSDSHEKQQFVPFSPLNGTDRPIPGAKPRIRAHN
jgi:hypothetical protein